jgi:NarL family two-component system response regulator LiaR
MDVLRLVLVDDYRMVTEAMASRLSASPDLWVAGCSQTDDPRLPEIIRWLRPDVVLIDVEPLGIAIAEVLGRIREAWPAARIIVVSADTDPGHAVEAARAGADAWVSKNQGADQLETVVRGVARGQSWYPPQMLGAVLRALRDDVRSAQESSSLLDSLSPREMDVLTSMAKGKRARQIAAELTISADTVRTHTRSIFGKLEVHSRIEAVRVAWAAGLRPPDAPGPSAAAPRDPSRRDPARPARPPSSAPAAPDQLSPAPPVSGQPGSGRLGSDQRGSGRLGSDQPGSGRPGSDQRGSGRPESGRPAPARHGSGPTGPAAVSGGTPEARRRRLPSTFRTRPGTPPEPRSS